MSDVVKLLQTLERYEWGKATDDCNAHLTIRDGRAVLAEITALRARVADLEREVALFGAWQKRDVAQVKRIAVLSERVAALEAALDKYGKHDGVCPRAFHTLPPPDVPVMTICSCGLSAAIAGQTEERPK